MPAEATRIASPIEQLGDHYDLLIVGSGYGGAIMVARLGYANHVAGQKLKIAVMERGAEYPTGTFPDTAASAVEAKRTSGNPLGIFEVLPNDTVDVLQGCGLGGTSLMNFNVAIVPDREVFLQSWPSAFRSEVETDPEGVGGLEQYYARARQMLGAVRYAEDENLNRIKVFEQIAEQVGVETDFAEITVSKQDRVTRFGVHRRRCWNNGDDGTGDNTGAKNTLMTNYLPMAKHYGVDLFTLVEVDRVEQHPDGGWRVVAVHHSGPEAKTPAPVEVRADRVGLSAGTLGTNGILLRSSANGLPLSAQLGKNFGGNGDALTVAYNTDTQPWNSRETGPRAELRCGPAINAVMRINADDPDLSRRATVEDLSIPSPIAGAVRIGLMSLAATLHLRDNPAGLNRVRKDVVFNTDGAMNHSLGFLIMVYDDQNGEVVLDSNRTPSIVWPDAHKHPAYAAVDEVLKPAVEAIGGSYIKNPRANNWTFGKRVFTAHPMGGCVTADSVDLGVVDDAGRVFHPDGGVHDGLYVADASVIPAPMGVNPLLTISMFAERSAERLREESGLPGYDPDDEGDDQAEGGEPVEPVAPDKTPAIPVTPVQRRLAGLRADAQHDRSGAIDATWAWLDEIRQRALVNRGRAEGEVNELFRLGTPPDGPDGSTQGMLVNTTFILSSLGPDTGPSCHAHHQPLDSVGR